MLTQLQRDQITQIWLEAGSQPKTHLFDSVPARVRRGKLGSFGQGFPQGDEVLILTHDDTVFGGGKQGFALTSRRVLARNMMEGAEQFAVERIASITHEPGTLMHKLIFAGRNGAPLTIDLTYPEGNPAKEALVEAIERIVKVLNPAYGAPEAPVATLPPSGTVLLPKCPACGAAAEGGQFCEYCGSSLVALP